MSDSDSIPWRLQKAREREHILKALVLAQESWQEILNLASTAADIADAAKRLQLTFHIDEPQARAVLDTQFLRVVPHERTRFAEDLTAVTQEIADLEQQLLATSSGGEVTVVDGDAPQAGWWSFEPRG